MKFWHLALGAALFAGCDAGPIDTDTDTDGDTSEDTATDTSEDTADTGEEPVLPPVFKSGWDVDGNLVLEISNLPEGTTSVKFGWVETTDGEGDSWTASDDSWGGWYGEDCLADTLQGDDEVNLCHSIAASGDPLVAEATLEKVGSFDLVVAGDSTLLWSDFLGDTTYYFEIGEDCYVTGDDVTYYEDENCTEITLTGFSS